MEPYEPKLLTVDEFYKLQDRMGELSPKPLTREEVKDLLFTIGEQNEKIENLRDFVACVGTAMESLK